ncbi:hypothetical protein [Kitasatospora griseola]|uniref:hypothetical protein n=1 Tax=Kitasatospora griseola TaxID=2064 RepID=UPI003654CE06
MIHNSEPRAAARIAAIADEAPNRGCTNVETRYEPATGLHIVTADDPKDSNRSTG